VYVCVDLNGIQSTEGSVPEKEGSMEQSNIQKAGLEDKSWLGWQCRSV